jgi:hypothetical protein
VAALLGEEEHPLHRLLRTGPKILRKHNHRDQCFDFVDILPPKIVTNIWL